MGSAELSSKQVVIYSHIITYGNYASREVTNMIREEIESMWNEPGGIVSIHNIPVRVIFSITAEFKPAITELEIYKNLDPRNNYFRIENVAEGNISFVDGLGCNSGYFLVENLYKGSTTAAHEYGHTLGLPHPSDTDHRGKGLPGIMFPRGTLVDPQYQYEPGNAAGTKGGTLFPIYRKVRQEDIQSLRLNRYRFNNNSAVIGSFTNVWHQPHQ